MLLVSVKKKKVFTGKKVMRRLSPIGREDSCDLSLSGKVGGGAGTEEETETHLKPASFLSPGFLVSGAVLNSSSQTHFLKEFGWAFLEGVGCRVALPWDSGLRGRSWNGYSVRNPLSLVTWCFCPLLIILRSLCWCIMVVYFCTHSFQENIICMGGCTLHSSIIQVPYLQISKAVLWI